MDTDRQLVESYRNGNSKASDKLIENNWKNLYSLCWRLLENREDAEEAVQQAFIAALKNINKFKSKSTFKTWLYSIALNECRRLLRVRRKQPLPLQETDDLPSTVNPETVLTKLEQKNALKRSLTALPFKQRAVIMLRINEELPFNKIASALGCSVNSAKVNFQHGINRLKEMLGTGDYEKTKN